MFSHPFVLLALYEKINAQYSRQCHKYDLLQTYTFCFTLLNCDDIRMIYKESLENVRKIICAETTR